MIYLLPTLYRDGSDTSYFVRSPNQVRAERLRALMPHAFMWRPVRYLGLGVYVATGLRFNYPANGFALVSDRPWERTKRHARGLLRAFTRYHEDPR